MAVYYTFPEAGTASIHVRYESFPDAFWVEPHMHTFYEFAFVSRGSCIHTYNSLSLPLIAGDLLLISPDEEHSYVINPDTDIINCYFFPERIYQLSSYIVDGSFHPQKPPKELIDFQAEWDHLLTTLSLRDSISPLETENASDLMQRQGILHLSPKAALQLESLLAALYEECSEPQYNSEEMKRAYLQLILGIFGRTGAGNVEKALPSSIQKKRQILNALTLIDEHYMDPITVQEMAQATSFSETSFRKIFKEVTGLSPLDYLNRYRIIQALRLIQFKDVPIADAAAQVGIYDANYFSRLFKKLLGYSPRYFRKIREDEV